MHIDWFFIINDLQRAGIPHEKAAEKVGVTRRTIGSWQSGITEPRYSQGSMLLELHRSVIRTT